MRRWLIGLATMSWLLLAACGGGQNAQTQEPQTSRGIADTTQLGGGGTRSGAAPAAAALGPVRDILVVGETAYALTAEGLALVDLRTPAEPKVMTTVLLGNGARRLAVSGTRAYVACGDNGLKVVDLSKPRTPQILGTYAPDTGGVDLVAAEGELVLAGLGPLGVAVLDVAQPSAPAERKRLASLKNPRELALSGRWGYVLGDKLTVLDVSKPVETKVATTFDPKEKGLALALAGKRALLAGARQTVLLDLTSPEKPARVAALAWSELNKQFPEAQPKPADTGIPERGAAAAPAKDPALRLAVVGERAWLLRDGRAFALALSERALKGTAALDDLGPVAGLAAAEAIAAVTAAGDLLVVSRDGAAAKVLGRLGLGARAPANGAGPVPPNPPTREGQAALDAVPEPKPALPTPAPPKAD